MFIILEVEMVRVVSYGSVEVHIPETYVIILKVM